MTAANSLLQHNASQLKALGLIPVTAGTGLGALALAGVTGSARGCQKLIASNYNAISCNQLIDFSHFTITIN